MTVSFRLWYRKSGGHIHVRVFSSEFGPETTHGLDGTLTMRPETWEAFRAALGRESGIAEVRKMVAAVRSGATPPVSWWRQALVRAAGFSLPPTLGAAQAEGAEFAARALGLADAVAVEFVDETEEATA